MGSPPRTKGLVAVPLVLPTVTSGLDGNVPPQTYAEETSPIAQTDPFARAMLEQSKALMTLVAHMQQGGDPLLDGQGSSSSGSLGTRGSVGREKLQKDLALKSGNFFLAVLQNAARRLRPASPKPSKELGLIQYALAHICDALDHSDHSACVTSRWLPGPECQLCQGSLTCKGSNV